MDFGEKFLLVRARQVPAELQGRDSVLPFRQVFGGGSRLQSNPCGSALTGGVDGILVNPCRASGGVDYVGRVDQQILPALAVEGHQAHAL